MRTIKVRVRHGQIEPLEPGELPPEGQGILFIQEEPLETVLVLERPAARPVGIDPVRARQALRESIGALAGLDRDAFLRSVTQTRGQNSRGRPA